jgi:hypothetical protein
MSSHSPMLTSSRPRDDGAHHGRSVFDRVKFAGACHEASGGLTVTVLVTRCWSCDQPTGRLTDRSMAIFCTYATGASQRPWSWCAARPKTSTSSPTAELVGQPSNQLPEALVALHNQASGRWRSERANDPHPSPVRLKTEDATRDRQSGIGRWAPLAAACSNAKGVSCRTRTSIGDSQAEPSCRAPADRSGGHAASEHRRDHLGLVPLRPM